MKKKIFLILFRLLPFIAAAFAMALVYSIFAFVCGDYNPRHWDNTLSEVAICWMIILGVIAFAVTRDSYL